MDVAPHTKVDAILDHQWLVSIAQVVLDVPLVASNANVVASGACVHGSATHTNASGALALVNHFSTHTQRPAPCATTMPHDNVVL